MWKAVTAALAVEAGAAADTGPQRVAGETRPVVLVANPDRLGYFLAIRELVVLRLER